MLYYDAKRGAMPRNPNEHYREQMQHLIDSEWYNTTQLFDIEEECPFGSQRYHWVEVQMIHALDKSTLKKTADDFRELIFRDIDYKVRLGTYYRFSDAYWITVNVDELNLISKNIIIHRCNNKLTWEDKKGKIYSYPCVMGYDATASSPRVDNDVITPNNRITVTVQANKDTLKLKANHRFIFGDRTFKIIGINNYMVDAIGGKQSILYFQVQLDEALKQDDFERGIAYNEEVVEEHDVPLEKKGIVVEPMFDCVRQNYIVEFSANKYIDNVKQEDIIMATTAGAPEWAYEFASLGNNQFSVKCKKVAKVPLEITFTDGDITKSILVDLKSMF